jgi:hypothetical protein
MRIVLRGSICSVTAIDAVIALTATDGIVSGAAGITDRELLGTGSEPFAFIKGIAQP